MNDYLTYPIFPKKFKFGGEIFFDADITQEYIEDIENVKLKPILAPIVGVGLGYLIANDDTPGETENGTPIADFPEEIVVVNPLAPFTFRARIPTLGMTKLR